jgi:hypothetical protein
VATLKNCNVGPFLMSQKCNVPMLKFCNLYTLEGTRETDAVYRGIGPFQALPSKADGLLFRLVTGANRLMAQEPDRGALRKLSALLAPDRFGSAPALNHEIKSFGGGK